MTSKFRHKPRLAYCGLTIVLSTPSRFDTHELLSGAAGYWFKSECLRPDVVALQCDIRTSNTLDEGLLNGTKCILLLGEKAMHEWGDARYKEYTLPEQRGCPLTNRWNLPCIASFFPQDAMDMKDYESIHNVHRSESDAVAYDSSEDDEDEGDLKKKGKTRRSNYRFWLMQDCKKILSLISGTRHLSTYGRPIPRQAPIIYPKQDEICGILRNIHDDDLFLDIECHPETQMLYCIGVSTSTSPAYVIPIFRYNGLHAYNNLGKLFASLAYAMSKNRTVCHNGFTFDLLLLAARYHIPFGRRNADTMAMQHRCFPEAEKSLGHCISLFTWEQYHKDEGSYEPHNEREESNLWHYNAKDVTTMRSIYYAILDYASHDAGLLASIEQVNNSIYPYALNSLVGLSYEEQEVIDVQREYDALMTQYLRLCRIALGRNFLPSSHKDVPGYFHGEMGYKIVARTKKGGASLGKGALYKLKLKYPNNPIIDICLKYRQVNKASGSLKFHPWSTYPNTSPQTLLSLNVTK